MDQRPSAKFISMLYLLATLTLLHTQPVQSVCQNGYRSSACICLNDPSCSDTEYREQTCSCNGGEDALQAIVSEIEAKNGRIESLYISGHNVQSLDELIGSLDVVERDLVIKGTALMSSEPIDSVRSVGKLAIVENPMLSNISGLGNLVNVTGDLLINENKMLEDISGLNRLTEVGGNLDISGNAMLTNISGFSELNRICNGSLKIERSSALLEISGLSKLETVGGVIIINNNQKLVDISGLKEVTEVSCGLRITENRELANLSGFGSKLRATGGLNISGNRRLHSLEGFQNLESIDGDLKLCNNNQFHVFGDTSNTLTMINGNVIIRENDALESLQGFENLTRVGGSLRIEKNVRLGSLSGLGDSLKMVDHNLAIAQNPKLITITALKNLTKVGHDFVIRGNSESLLLRGLDNLKMVGGELALVGPFVFDGVLAELERVAGDLRIRNAREPDSGNRSRMGSLTCIGKDMILRDNILSVEYDFPRLTTICGDLIIRNNTFEGKNILPSVETVEGELEISDMKNFKNGTNLNILPNLLSLCRNPSKGECGLQIRGNKQYKWIKGFQHLNNFNGCISIVRNPGLQTITGFNKLTWLTIAKPKSGLPNDGSRVDCTLGALIIRSNRKLTSIQGFKSLKEVEGDLFISKNRFLNRLVLENLECVGGLTQIFGNSENLTNIALTEPVLCSKPGCRSRRKQIVPSNSISESQDMFIPKLVRHECVVEKIIPTVVGISIFVALLILAVLIFIYMRSRQDSCGNQKNGNRNGNPNGDHNGNRNGNRNGDHNGDPNGNHIGDHNGNRKKNLREDFAIYVLSVADALSDAGFTANAFLVWKVKDPSERDGGLFVIGMFSGFVLVGFQFCSAVSVYLQLYMKKDDDVLRLNEMKFGDCVLLFLGLPFLLDANAAKYIFRNRQSNSSTGGAENAQNYLCGFFERFALKAGTMEDLIQIVLQLAFVFIVEEDEGWAITAAIASLTLSMANLVVKIAILVEMCQAARAMSPDATGS